MCRLFRLASYLYVSAAITLFCLCANASVTTNTAVATAGGRWEKAAILAAAGDGTGKHSETRASKSRRSRKLLQRRKRKAKASKTGPAARRRRRRSSQHKVPLLKAVQTSDAVVDNATKLTAISGSSVASIVLATWDAATADRTTSSWLCVGLLLSLLITLLAKPEYQGAGAGTVSIALWMSSSIAMNFVNKHAVDLFPAINLLVILQMIISALVLLALEHRRMWIGKWSDVARWSVVPVLFACILGTSLWALKASSVSMVLILRNVLPLVTLAVDKLFFGVTGTVATMDILSVFVVILGTILYTRSNMAVTTSGIVLVLINCTMITVDRTLQSHLLKRPDFSISPPMCSLINNVFGIFPMLVLAAATDEIRSWASICSHVSLSTWRWVLLSGCCGCALGYFGLLAQKVLSATSFMMMQNLSKVVIILVAVTVMGDIMPGMSAIGCALSMAGSFYYCFSQLPAEIEMQSCGGEGRAKSQGSEQKAEA